jgi:hypothetical protein
VREVSDCRCVTRRTGTYQYVQKDGHVYFRTNAIQGNIYMHLYWWDGSGWGNLAKGWNLQGNHKHFFAYASGWNPPNLFWRVTTNNAFGDLFHMFWKTSAVDGPWDWEWQRPHIA